MPKAHRDRDSNGSNGSLSGGSLRPSSLENPEPIKYFPKAMRTAPSDAGPKTRGRRNSLGKSAAARQERRRKKADEQEKATQERRRNRMRREGKIQRSFKAAWSSLHKSPLVYHPVETQEPYDFTEEGYRLQSVENGHKIKVFTVITMYNEEASELERTLRGVFQNLHAYCRKYGPDAWQDWCVCIVSDGRTKANKGTLDYMHRLGIFDNQLMENALEDEDQDVRMHLFESNIAAFEDLKFDKPPTLQMMFALKEHNGGKLDSHLWFFNAFAEQLQPKYTMLLDVGTQPERTAMFKLINCMEQNSKVAGVCGEIVPGVEEPMPGTHLDVVVTGGDHELIQERLEEFFREETAVKDDEAVKREVGSIMKEIKSGRSTVSGIEMQLQKKYDVSPELAADLCEGKIGRLLVEVPQGKLQGEDEYEVMLLEEGQRVELRNGAGRISRVHADGTFGIEYDSHDVEDEEKVGPQLIKMLGDSSLNSKKCTHIKGKHMQQGKSRVTKKYFTSNLVVAATIFEYKTSHILDKALECSLGFISVLPGAFSGYRYRAIKVDLQGNGPLREYFLQLKASMSDLGAFKANMYLAEDRILCFELLARRGCAWKLEYVKNAVAVTDVPDTLPNLIKQRRRWLNGSLFAMLYAIIHSGRFLEESAHNLWFKFLVFIEFGYQIVNQVLTWLLCANFFLAFYFLIRSTNLACFGDVGDMHLIGSLCVGDWQKTIGGLMIVVYLCLIVAQIICGLGNDPAKIPSLYKVSQYFFGVYTIFTVILSLQFIFSYDQQICFSHQEFDYPSDMPGGWGCLSTTTHRRDPHFHMSWPWSDPKKKLHACAVQYQFSGKAKNFIPFPEATCEQLNSMFGNKPYDLIPLNRGNDSSHTYCETYCGSGQHAKKMEDNDCDMVSNGAATRKTRKFGLHIKNCVGPHCPGCLPPTFLKFFGGASIGVFFAAALIHFDVLAIFFNFPQYLFMLPTFINIFMIYSYCNFHDVSWGTKGLEEEEVKKRKKNWGAVGSNEQISMEQRDADKQLTEILQARHAKLSNDERKEAENTRKAFRNFRSFTLILWLFTNFIFCYLITASLLDTSLYLPFLFIVAGLFIGFRMLGSLFYMLQRWFGLYFYRQCCTDTPDTLWGSEDLVMLEANEADDDDSDSARGSPYGYDYDEAEYEPEEEEEEVEGAVESV